MDVDVDVEDWVEVGDERWRDCVVTDDEASGARERS